MGDPNVGRIDAYTQKYAAQFQRQFPWFEYEGTADPVTVAKWMAKPNLTPAPGSEFYHKYAVDRYAQEIMARLAQGGGMCMFGQIEGMELVDTGANIELRVNGVMNWNLWCVGKVSANGLQYGDMGTFALLRLGYMSKDIDIDAYLMGEDEKFALAVANAQVKQDLPAYKGNPKAFTADTGFLVTSMDLEPVYNGEVWIGYRSVMNVDWTQQVNTKKPGVGFYG